MRMDDGRHGDKLSGFSKDSEVLKVPASDRWPVLTHLACLPDRT